MTDRDQPIRRATSFVTEEDVPSPDPTDPRFAGVVAATANVVRAEDRCRQYAHSIGYHQALARTARTVKKRQAAEETAGHATIAYNEAFAEFQRALADAYNAVLEAERIDGGAS